MNTAENIAKLRDLIGEPTDANGWNDERLGNILDDSTSVREAAATVWRAKAASYAHLVDITEGGSSRKMSSLYTNALKMADSMLTEDGSTGPISKTRRPTTRAITRPGWI